MMSCYGILMIEKPYYFIVLYFLYILFITLVMYVCDLYPRDATSKHDLCCGNVSVWMSVTRRYCV